MWKFAEATGISVLSLVITVVMVLVIAPGHPRLSWADQGPEPVVPAVFVAGDDHRPGGSAECPFLKSRAEPRACPGMPEMKNAASCPVLEDLRQKVRQEARKKALGRHT